MGLPQLVEVVQPTGGAALLATALSLGLRHGIDWDHIAAISDITGTSGTVVPAEGGQRPADPLSRTGSRARAPRRTAGGLLIEPVAGGATAGTVRVTFPRSGWAAASGGSPGTAAVAARGVNWQAVSLASLYAMGHALVVLVLGLMALLFGAILPEWVDPIMERVVGATLVALGVWVTYSLVRFWRGDGEFRLQSRWMLVFSGLRRAHWALQQRLHGHTHGDRTRHVHRLDQYGPGTAFGTGVIHGIGAETGTQVLIIAAVGGAAGQGLGGAMLLAFVAGLLLSNTAVAVLTSAGFVSARRMKALYIAAGVLAAVVSLWVGTYALLGASDRLPDLQVVLTTLFGEGPA